MQGLKQCVKDKQDPVWQQIQSIDIKNLFPKYEVAKIERSKTRFDKFRLMMDNLDEFLFFERHKKGVDDQSQEIESLKKKVQQLVDRSYDFEFIKSRQSVERITNDLNRYGNSVRQGKKQPKSPLINKIEESQKWRKYFKDNCQNVDKYDPALLLPEKIKLAETARIPSSCPDLNETVCHQILLRRLQNIHTNQAVTSKWTKKTNLQTDTELAFKDQVPADKELGYSYV